MDQSTPAGQDHETQRSDAATGECQDGLNAGMFALPLGIVLFLATSGMALLNTVLGEFGTPPDIRWPLLIAMPLAVIAGALRMRPASAGGERGRPRRWRE